MNLFGVLKFKKMGEDFLLNSGLPYTIIRYMAYCCFFFIFFLLDAEKGLHSN